MLRISPALLSVFVLAGCGTSPVSPDPVATHELQNAPTSVVIGGKAVTLATSLWRDFMPIAPPDGKPLAGVLRVRAVDGSAVPAGMAADTAWVVRGSEVWSSFVPPPSDKTAAEYETTFSNGPKWGPDEIVDVVIRLRDAAGSVVLLRAPQQRIIGTM
jgi:hypothetical protein